MQQHHLQQHHLQQHPLQQRHVQQQHPLQQQRPLQQRILQRQHIALSSFTPAALRPRSASYPTYIRIRRSRKDGEVIEQLRTGLLRMESQLSCVTTYTERRNEQIHTLLAEERSRRDRDIKKQQGQINLLDKRIEHAQRDIAKEVTQRQMFEISLEAERTARKFKYDELINKNKMNKITRYI